MKLLNKVLSTILAVMVAVMVVVCCWQVITRFVLNDPSKWSEEFLKYALIWLTMIGAPYAYGQNKQLSINILTNNFSAKGKVIDKLVVEVLILIVSIVVFVIGGITVTANAAGQTSAAMHLPMQVYYVCIPIGGALMIVYCIDHLVKLAKEMKEVK